MRCCIRLRVCLWLSASELAICLAQSHGLVRCACTSGPGEGVVLLCACALCAVVCSCLIDQLMFFECETCVSMSYGMHCCIVRLIFVTRMSVVGMCCSVVVVV